MANAKGVDISHWQTLSEWSTTGLTFVICKASEGTNPDDMFQKHVAKARAAGLIVGAYAFNRDDVDMQAQVDAFAKYSAGADIFAIDVEGAHAFTSAQTRDFCNRFRAKTGKKIGLYHSASGFFDAGQDWDWVAHWGVSEPSRSWDLHQYRGAPLDLDQFNGTAAEMRAWVAALNSTGGSKVNSFTTPETRLLAKVKTGAWLYDNSDLSASSGNIKIDPGRYLVYVGQFSASPDIRIVAYEPAAGDTNTTSKAMFCARDSIESFANEPDTTPYDQADLDAAVAAAVAPLQEVIDSQAAIIAAQKTELVEANLTIDRQAAQIVSLNEQVASLTAQVDKLAPLAADYDTLRKALRKAVAP